MGFIKEFKDFAMKGNVVDMAVGIVIGAAFGKIVSSLVDNIIMPMVAYMTSGKSVADAWKIKLGEPPAEGEQPFIALGAFSQTIIDFLIIAIAIFLAIKVMNTIRSRFESGEDDEAPSTKACNECKMAIPIEAKKCGHCTSVVG